MYSSVDRNEYNRRVKFGLKSANHLGKNVRKFQWGVDSHCIPGFCVREILTCSQLNEHGCIINSIYEFKVVLLKFCNILLRCLILTSVDRKFLNLIIVNYKII